MALGDKIAHAWFDNRTAARLQGFDLACAEVNADYIMSLMRKAGRSDRADIAESEDADGATHVNTLFPFMQPPNISSR